MDLGLKDAVILVTGGAASGGIGAAITDACLDEGAKVVVVGRVDPSVVEFMQYQQNTNRPCELIEAELANPDECKRAVNHVQQRYGRLDGLVNSAGINDGIGLDSGTPDQFIESLRQNLLHYFSMAHYALPMLKASRGSIVNISSKVAITGQGGTSAYAAAKAAQLGLTREWAADLAPFGIRSNAVIPAEVITPSYHRWLANRDDPAAALQSINQRIPLGHRMTLPSEIAATVVFLLSAKQAGHITGQHLSVDGGYTHLDRALS